MSRDAPGDEQSMLGAEPRPLRVLILEDRPADAELIELELRRAGLELEWTRVDSERDFLASLSEDLDVILSDYSMPQFDALRALSLLLTVPAVLTVASIPWLDYDLALVGATLACYASLVLAAFVCYARSSDRFAFKPVAVAGVIFATGWLAAV